MANLTADATFERVLVWTITITQVVEHRAGGRTYAIRPLCLNGIPYLCILCDPGDAGHFLIIANGVSPLPPTMGLLEGEDEDPDNMGWSRVVIPLPRT